MRRPVAYVSSSAAELTEYRRDAFELLDLYQFERRGMEHYEGQSDSDIVRRCQRDAADADYLVLIVAFRYGTAQPDFGGKSIVELEYEAATASGREVLVFCLEESQRLDAAFDDRIQLDDRGAQVMRFRKRLIQEHRLVSFFTTPQSFRDNLGRTLSLRYADFVRAQAEEMSRKATVDPVADALARSLDRLPQEQMDLDAIYVPLAGMTTLPRSARWPDAVGDAALPYDGDEGAGNDLKPLTNILDALDVHKQSSFYLVGEPGGGKSLTLRALELEAGRRYLANPHLPFPLRVDVSTWLPAQQDFVSLIADELQTKTGVAHFPVDRLLLLLDGAIDSAVARADDPVEKIAAWLKAHPRCTAILAVRLRAPRGGNLPVVRIHQLDDDRVRLLAAKRLQSEERAASLLEKIGWEKPTGGRDIRALMRNPFNLSLLCRLENTNKPPATQGELIRQVVLTRLAREATRLGIPPMADRFLDAFGAVAVAIIRNRGLLASDVGEVMKSVSDVDELVDLLKLAFESKIIQEREGRKGFEFEHRLYLEYFAAESFRLHPELFAELKNPRFELGQRVPQRFDEVVHTAAELEPASATIERIAAHDPFLAAACLSAVPAATDERQNAEIAVADGLVRVLRANERNGREEAGAALAEIGVSAVEYLRRSLRDSRHWVRRTAVRTLARIPHIDAVHAVVLALGDSHRWVRDDAAAALRLFDARFRDLLVQLLSSPRWKDGHDRRIDERLATAFRNDERLAETIARVTGIPAAAVAQAEPATPPRVEPPPKPEQEPESKPGAPDSGGAAWLADWHADPGNEALADRGLSWLRSATKSDPKWPDVLTTLWRRAPADEAFERLGRLWLDRTEPSAESWPHVLLLLLRAKPKEAAIATTAAKWLRDADVHHRGWPLVFAELWARDDDRKPLLRPLGLSWLQNVPLSTPRWWQVWQLLWYAGAEKTELSDLGRRWIADAHPDSIGWRFVWPAVWSASQDDRVLVDAALRWFAQAPLDHPAWGRIFPPLFTFLGNRNDLSAIGRRWLANAPAHHDGWIAIWEALWKAHPRDRELEEHARRWLSVALPSNNAWVKIWALLWREAEGDAGLVTLGRQWLQASWASASGWSLVFSSLLKLAPGDPELTRHATAFLDSISETHRAWTAWASVWKDLWDYGGDRAHLAAIGRKWVLGKGMRHGGFSFVWERLWMQQPDDQELRNLGLQWLRRSPKDRTWAHGWDRLWRAAPSDRELVNLAMDHLRTAGPDAVDWAYTWRALADSGIDDPWFLQLGADWLAHHPPDSDPRGWAYVWTYFVARDPNLVEDGWKWMKLSSFERNTWPDVWEALWTHDSAQRPLLAVIAVDWLGRRGARPERIKRWKEIAAMPLDATRQEILQRFLEGQHLGEPV